MLVEHLKPCYLGIDDLYLKPGVNKVDDSKWDRLASSKKWKSQIERLISTKRIQIIDGRERVSVALVQKTFDLDLLDEWLQKAKGPIKGAIKKQIKSLEIEDAG